MTDSPLTSPRISPDYPVSMQTPLPATGALSNSASSSQACGTGATGGNDATAHGHESDDALSTGVSPKITEPYKQAKAAWEAANPGMKVYAFSGVQDRPQNASSLHPSGQAMDVVIIGSDGVRLNNLKNGDTPAFRAYESFATAMGNAGFTGRWGGNFGGTWYRDTMHFDLGNPNVVAQGNVFKGVANPAIPGNSNPSGGIKYNGPTSGSEANAGGASNASAHGSATDSALNSKGNTKNATCASPSSSGCQPISAGAPAVASSLASGQGLAMPDIMSTAMSAIQGGIGGVLQGALGTALNSAAGMLTSGVNSIVQGGIQALTSGGLSNVLSQITTPVMNQLISLGSSTALSSLTGVIPSALASSGLSGNLIDNITTASINIIQQNVTNLGGFPSVFSTASSASAGGSNLSKALNSSVTQVFGKATDGVLSTQSIPGYDLASIGSSYTLTSMDEGIEGMSNIVSDSWIPAANKSISLVGPMAEVLETAVNSDSIYGFGTLFKDYNSLVTQGFGNLTDHLLALGADLYALGKFGDLNDLLNVGTPKQLARQLVENGLGVTTGLLEQLSNAGISVADIQNTESDDFILQILKTIDDPDVVQSVKDKFGIADQVNLKTVADLLDPVIVFPQSYHYNYFKNIQDMVMTLALCGSGTGNLKSLGDLGLLMINMETVETSTALLNEYAPVRFDEVETLKTQLPPVSKFNDSDPVVADFIGTAAGYIHSNTLPRMHELHDTIFGNAYLTKFNALMTLLTNALHATYTSGSNVVIPTTAGYTFGTYTSLNAAVTAIKTAIETEMNSLSSTLPTTDPAFWAIMLEYNALHTESAEYLAHEKAMRTAYGVDIGPTKYTENFYADGSTLVYPLGRTATGVSMLSIDGVLKLEHINWTFDTSTNSVTLIGTAPSARKVISITYDTGLLPAQSSTVDVWQMATALESHALDTGYGSPADFLSRLTTDDMHGQRIDAIMIQARNKARLDNVGIACPGYNRVLNDDDSKYFNFVEKTGIWSSNPSRAGEIWLQKTQDVNSTEEYVVNRIRENADKMISDNDSLMQNVTRQLIFLLNNQIVVSDKFSELYKNSINDALYSSSRPDMKLTYNRSLLPYDGYNLGSYVEIVSAICKVEGYEDTVFNIDLSTETSDYLSKVGVDMNLVTAVLQRTLMVSLASNLGISEDEARDIFGVQSVAKHLLANISKGI